MEMTSLTNLRFTESDILNKRENIRQCYLKQEYPILRTVGKPLKFNLELLFKLYDAIFFTNFFSKSLQNKIDFSLSTRMTRSAGKTIYMKKPGKGMLEEHYEIRIGQDFFNHYEKVERMKKVSGIETKDALEALQIVFEHELCHLIEFYYFKNSSCKKERFKQLAYQIFGHTGVYHELPTVHEIVKKEKGVGVGDMVTFFGEGKTMEGVIYKIQKRAVIMVKDKKGSFHDSQGVRYNKWYVPLELLARK